jgi:hypothetical protein
MLNVTATGGLADGVLGWVFEKQRLGALLDLRA